MRRNFWLDTLLLLISVILAVTGWSLWDYSLRRPRIIPRYLPALDKRRAPWLEVHRIFSVSFIFAVILHLAWHWRWIADNTPKVMHGED